MLKSSNSANPVTAVHLHLNFGGGSFDGKEFNVAGFTNRVLLDSQSHMFGGNDIKFGDIDKLELPNRFEKQRRHRHKIKTGRDIDGVIFVLLFDFLIVLPSLRNKTSEQFDTEVLEHRNLNSSLPPDTAFGGDTLGASEDPSADGMTSQVVADQSEAQAKPKTYL